MKSNTPKFAGLIEQLLEQKTRQSLKKILGRRTLGEDSSEVDPLANDDVNDAVGDKEDDAQRGDTLGEAAESTGDFESGGDQDVETDAADTIETFLEEVEGEDDDKFVAGESSEDDEDDQVNETDEDDVEDFLDEEFNELMKSESDESDEEEVDESDEEEVDESVEDDNERLLTMDSDESDEEEIEESADEEEEEVAESRGRRSRR